MIASQKVANVGEAVDLAVEAMRREDHRKRKERSASYAEEPSLEAVAEDHATIRAMRNSNPDLLFGE